MLCPRFQLAQGASICEDELIESHEWLTDDLNACTIGSSQKTFLLIDPDCFEVRLFRSIAFHTQQLEKLRYRHLFEVDGLVERLG